MAMGSQIGYKYSYPEYVGFKFEEDYFPQIKVCFVTTAEQGTLKAFLYNEIEKIYSECSTDDWAGNKKEKSYKINIDSYIHAKRFVEYIPDIVAPSVIPYYDGKIGFEWNVDNKILIAIKFNEENVFTYSIITPEESDFGTKMQLPFIQKEFANRLERLLSC